MTALVYTEQEDAQIIQRHDREGEPLAAIASSLGRSHGSVKSRLEKLRRSRVQKPATLPNLAASAWGKEIEHLEIAALRAELNRLRQEPHNVRQPVSCPADTSDEPDLKELWATEEAKNTRSITRQKQTRQLATKFNDNQPIAIAFIADQHIAPGTPDDMARMRQDAELIAKTDGLYAILAGDGVDNHIKHTSAMLAARSQPEEQWRLFNWYLEIFAPKILALCAGNHDLWSNQFAGVDVLRRIAEQQKLRYSTNEFFLTLDVAGAVYKIAVRHQYRLNSSFNQGHAVRQWLRLGHEDFDVGCIGHHHEGTLDNFLWRGQHRIAIRPGSYQITSAYSSQYGWNDAVPLCPTVLFWPQTRQMLGVFDVRPAAELLEKYRG